MARSTPSIDDLSDSEQYDEYEEYADMVRVRNLTNYQPLISFEELPQSTAEVQQISNDLNQEASRVALVLQNDSRVQESIYEIHSEARYCNTEDGSEDYWSYFVTWPILRLAREMSGVKHEVRIVPLYAYLIRGELNNTDMFRQTTKIGSETLLPQSRFGGKRIDRRIDFGIFIEMDPMDLQNHLNRIDPLGQLNPPAEFGIGPSDKFNASPLFCHVEVKKPMYLDDPLVQLGVWTSAVYSRWEQIRALQDVPNRDLHESDFPILFGWTTLGHSWSLYIIRRLPDGSRRFTFYRSYDTRSIDDINIVVATLCYLINQGATQFRQSFLTNILGLPVSNSTKPAIRKSARRKNLKT